MTVESATYISDLVPANPDGSTIQVNELDNHDRLIKTVLQATFPNANGAINPTPTEFNYLVGVTSAIQTQIDAKQASDAGLTDIAALAVTDGNFIVGDGANWVAESGATARASIGIDGSTGIIQEGDIDWANAGGISHITINDYVEFSQTGSTFITQKTIQIYIPANANSLEYVVELNESVSAVQAIARLTTDTNNGTAPASTGTTYDWYGPGTLDISDKSGWTDINIQLRDANNAGTAFLRGIMGRFI